MRLFVKSLLYSLPIWIFLVVDTEIYETVRSDLVRVFIYYPGWYLYALIVGEWNAVENADWMVVCILNCIVYYIVMLLALYLYDMVRHRRKSLSR